MNTTIQKWGNSQGVRIPKIILDQSGFTENDKLEFCVCEDGIILKKVSRRKHITLEERLEAFYGKPMSRIENIEQSDEFDTGLAVGEEVW